MYNLTSFSRTELRVLSDLIQEKLDSIDYTINVINNLLPDGDVKDEMILKDHRRRSVLKEINVRVLTSLQIVRDKDKEVAN